MAAQFILAYRLHPEFAASPDGARFAKYVSSARATPLQPQDCEIGYRLASRQALHIPTADDGLAGVLIWNDAGMDIALSAMELLGANPENEAYLFSGIFERGLGRGSWVDQALTEIRWLRQPEMPGAADDNYSIEIWATCLFCGLAYWKSPYAVFALGEDERTVHHYLACRLCGSWDVNIAYLNSRDADRIAEAPLYPGLDGWKRSRFARGYFVIPPTRQDSLGYDIPLFALRGGGQSNEDPRDESIRLGGLEFTNLPRTIYFQLLDWRYIVGRIFRYNRAFLDRMRAERYHVFIAPGGGADLLEEAGMTIPKLKRIGDTPDLLDYVASPFGNGTFLTNELLRMVSEGEVAVKKA